MANYQDWNQAIYQHITAGLPPGSRIFLSTDDEALVSAGRLLKPVLPHSERVQDFLQAVRKQFVLGNKIQNLSPADEEPNAVPSYLSFLAATVLAAYRMAESDEVSQTNYFIRLKEILEIRDEGDRPLGFKAGTEEPLWKHWSGWLIHKGYLSSAQPGEGAWKYVSYPISQTLLRQADREALWRHFTNRRWSRNLDEDVVIARTMRENPYLPSHLQNLLTDDSMRQARKQGLLQAIYDLYDLWTNSGAGGQNDYGQAVGNGQARNLIAGLYRTFDHFKAEPEYAILPHQARRLQVELAQVSYKGQLYKLNPIKPGWYQPFGQISDVDLDSGLRIPIDGAEELDKLILPHRDFWILTPDSDEPYSGIYASWGKPAIGTPFIILCRNELESQLQQLRLQGLIQWRDNPLPVWANGSWLEFEDVMVISDGWGAIIFENNDLLESLQPGKSIGISLSGGLRTEQGSWLVGYGPAISVNTFEARADLTIVNPLTDSELQSYQDLKTNEPFQVDWPSRTGSYLLRVTTSNSDAERFVTLHDWESLSPARLNTYGQISLAEVTISGASIAGENQ